MDEQCIVTPVAFWEPLGEWDVVLVAHAEETVEDDVADAVIAMACPPGLNDIIPSGIYNVTSRTMVSWWDIVDCMGIRRSDVTFNPVEVGAIGDPRGLTASGEKLAAHGFTCKRLVADGIREALASLGYTRRG